MADLSLPTFTDKQKDRVRISFALRKNSCPLQMFRLALELHAELDQQSRMLVSAALIEGATEGAPCLFLSISQRNALQVLQSCNQSSVLAAFFREAVTQ